MHNKIALFLVLAMVGIAWAGASGTISGFDAGKTFVFHVGDTFCIELAGDAAGQWSWPAIDEAVVRHLKKENGLRAGKAVERHTFTVVGIGTVDLYAELTNSRDPGKVPARFPITVQVVPG